MAITIDGTAGTIAGLVAGGLPSGSVTSATIADATIASGDIASGVVPAGGKVLQVVTTDTASSTNSTSTTYADTGLTASITPSSTSNKILVLVTQAGVGKSEANDTYCILQLNRDGTDILGFEKQAGFTLTAMRNLVGACTCSWLDNPSTTSTVVYKTRFRSNNNGSAVNVNSNGSTSTITLMEIQG
jgi:hypothetical protein